MLFLPKRRGSTTSSSFGVRDPYVLMLEEPDFYEISARVKGRGLSIVLPLKKYLAGMRA